MSGEPRGQEGLESAFALEELAPHRFRGPSVPSVDRSVVFGGQLLGQAIVASAQTDPDKTVRQVELAFLRPGTIEQPVDVLVDVLRKGRSLSLLRVDLVQGERLLASGQVVLDASEPDLVEHASPPTRVPAERPPADGVDAGDAAAFGVAGAAGQPRVHVVGDVDLLDGEAVGRPEVDIWARWPGSQGPPEREQALLVWNTVPFAIGAGLRPHRGVGGAQAHASISTGVLSHTVLFHRAVSARGWHLVRTQAPYAGQGRIGGHGQVWSANGTLALTFLQHAMARRMSTAGLRSGTVAERL